MIYAIALFGLRIFDPVPAAYRTVVAQMQSGILVFDGQGPHRESEPGGGADAQRAQRRRPRQEQAR
ncbi:MAG: hypothetical protein R2838_25635 [Caldilineaceae bacterium]